MPSFEEIFEAHEIPWPEIVGPQDFRDSYLSRGNYAPQIENFLKYFDENKVLIIESKCFFKSPQKTMDQIFKFLDIPGYVFDKTHFKKFNRTASQAEMNPATKTRLQNYFTASNKKLKEFVPFQTEDW